MTEESFEEELRALQASHVSRTDFDQAIASSRARISTAARDQLRQAEEQHRQTLEALKAEKKNIEALRSSPSHQSITLDGQFEFPNVRQCPFQV